jgi:hypothetical protein
VKSKDPLDQPEIDPHIFERDFGKFVLSFHVCSTHAFMCIDLELMVQQFKYIQNIDVEPWKSNIVQEMYPGLKAETDEDIRGTFATAEVTHD